MKSLFVGRASEMNNFLVSDNTRLFCTSWAHRPVFDSNVSTIEHTHQRKLQRKLPLFLSFYLFKELLFSYKRKKFWSLQEQFHKRALPLSLFKRWGLNKKKCIVRFIKIDTSTICTLIKTIKNRLFYPMLSSSLN